MAGEHAENRSVIRITGSDRAAFLQGLITNDVARSQGQLLYAALLTPQGKYIADFLVLSLDDAILLDCAATQAEALLRRLSMYKLRADVTLALTDHPVTRGTGPAPAGGLPDPRHPALGWRAYDGDTGHAPQIDWDRIRVAHCIPESGIELIPDETYILEAGFERLQGVDFRKGCYVGQEVTARMKHKTELKKGLITVAVTGEAPVGTPIEAGGKLAGMLYTQSGGQGIAWLRFDRAGPGMIAGDASVSILADDG